MPIDRAYRVVFRIPHGSEFPGSEIFIPKDTDLHVTITTEHYLEPKDYAGRKADMEFTPELYVSPVGTKEISGQSILLDGIPVKGKENWMSEL